MVQVCGGYTDGWPSYSWQTGGPFKTGNTQATFPRIPQPYRLPAAATRLPRQQRTWHLLTALHLFLYAERTPRRNANNNNNSSIRRWSAIVVTVHPELRSSAVVIKPHGICTRGPLSPGRRIDLSLADSASLKIQSLIDDATYPRPHTATFFLLVSTSASSGGAHVY